MYVVSLVGRIRVAALLTTLLLAPPVSEARPKFPHLGGYPLCEASAAVWTPCLHDAAVTCLLVGDNEQRQTLFSIPFDGHRLEVDKRQPVDMTPVLSPDDEPELSDIEALTILGSGDVLIYGSHSRNKACERRASRRRYVSLKFEQTTVVAGAIELVRTKKTFDLANAFPDGAAGDLQQVREAVKATEANADANAPCEGAFNIEGAVAFPGPSGDEVWVGLRAPLVDGNAVLARHKSGLKALEFDAVRFVDLGGWGIRDLTYARGWVWGLSGPVADDEETTFRLWRFRVNAFARQEVIAVEPLGDAPNGAEGLAIWGNVAVMVMDGSELSSPPAIMDGVESRDICKRDASYAIVSVPW